MFMQTQTEGTMNGQPVNAIDPGLYRDANGNVWMIYGSHYAGIFIVQGSIVAAGVTPPLAINIWKHRLCKCIV